jgi:hypothetical protein
VEKPVFHNALKGNSNLITVERSSFYPWSCPNMVFRRGPALIFSQPQSHMAIDFGLALKQLEFTPVLFDLLKTEETLINGEISDHLFELMF